MVTCADFCYGFAKTSSFSRSVLTLLTSVASSTHLRGLFTLLALSLCVSDLQRQLLSVTLSYGDLRERFLLASISLSLTSCAGNLQ